MNKPSLSLRGGIKQMKLNEKENFRDDIPAAKKFAEETYGIFINKFKRMDKGIIPTYAKALSIFNMSDFPENTPPLTGYVKGFSSPHEALSETYNNMGDSIFQLLQSSMQEVLSKRPIYLFVNSSGEQIQPPLSIEMCLKWSISVLLKKFLPILSDLLFDTYKQTFEIDYPAYSNFFFNDSEFVSDNKNFLREESERLIRNFFIGGSNPDYSSPIIYTDGDSTVQINID